MTKIFSKRCKGQSTQLVSQKESKKDHEEDSRKNIDKGKQLFANVGLWKRSRQFIK